jgi:hypothetical protein
MNRGIDEYWKNKKYTTKAARMFEKNDCDRSRFPCNGIPTNEFEQWPHRMIFFNDKKMKWKRKELLLMKK